MITLLLLVIFLTCLGIAAAWVAENPGTVTLYWFDWRIDTSVAFLFLAAVVGAFVLAYLIILVRKIILAPGQISTARQLKKYRRGLSELTYSVASLAASDIRHAERHTRKAERLLGQTPLTLLLSAQIARSQGDDGKTRELLEHMLEHKETEYLAARSLSDAASKQRLFPHALAMAERAHEINPKDTASSIAMIGLYIRLGRWDEALQAASKSKLRHADKLHYKGLVHLKQGMSLFENGQKAPALAHAKTAMKILSGFAPAIVFAAKCLDANGQKDKAIKLIVHAWKRTPNPELAVELQTLIASLPKERQMKIAKSLVSVASKHPESALAMAQIAIFHREWDIARKSLKAALAREETARACKLMADLEQAESSDFDAAGRWMSRSAAAAPDANWVCQQCTHISDHWDSHCISCGSFDTMHWKGRTVTII